MINKSTLRFLLPGLGFALLCSTSYAEQAVLDPSVGHYVQANNTYYDSSSTVFEPSLARSPQQGPWELRYDF
jgi:hypothetical protein